MYYSQTQFSMFCQEDDHIILDKRYYKMSLFCLFASNDVIWNYVLEKFNKQHKVSPSKTKLLDK